MKVKLFSVNSFGVNCYLVYHQKEAIIVDPGGPSEAILEFLAENELQVVAIVNTHGHADHIAGNTWFIEKTKAPLLIHEGDAKYLNDPKLHLGPQIYLDVPDSQADCLLKDGDVLKVGGEEITVLHTPGHSRGGISLLGPGFVLSGDTLFKESIGRFDFPESNEADLGQSLKRLTKLPPETIVYPGHGPSSTIAHELKNNPFLDSLKGVK